MSILLNNSVNLLIQKTIKDTNQSFYILLFCVLQKKNGVLGIMYITFM